MKTMHLAYGHRTDDTRIFKKECVSLAKSGYEVIFVTSDKISKETTDQSGVKRIIVPLRKKNRLTRLYFYLKDLKRLVKKIKPDVCHIHDFQILPFVLIAPKGVKCIFDSHEDYPADIADTVMKRVNFKLKFDLVTFIEKVCFKKCTHIITATPYIRSEIEKFFSKVTDVNNYPVVGMKEGINAYNSSQICFTGGTGEASGLTNVAGAIANTQYRLVIAGSCSDDYLEKLNSLSEKRIEYLGYLNKKEVDELIKGSLAGLVSYLPALNCIHAVPNKMFEYMECGTPIIYSKFEYWVDMLDKYDVGIAVNPNDPEEILSAINTLKNDGSLRERLAGNAREAVEKVFNWENEEKKLLNVYDSIMSD